MSTLPKYIAGSTWRCTQEIKLGWGDSAKIPAGTPFIVTKTNHNLYYNPVSVCVDGELQKPQTLISSAPTSSFKLVKQSPRIFYGIRRIEDGKIMREGSAPWRWGYTKCYLTKRGAFDYVATKGYFSAVEVVEFTADRQSELAKVRVVQPPEGWAARCQKLRSKGAWLGSALFDDSWQVALIFDRDDRTKLFDAKLKLGKNIRWPASLHRSFWERPVVLFKTKMEAMKHRLALPECEWVDLRD